MPNAEMQKLHSLIVSHKPAMGFAVRLFAEKEGQKVPDELHVLPFGKWDHPIYGKFTIDDEVVQTFIANFQNKLLRKQIPITAGHDGFEESPAVGWFEELYARETGLYAKVTWTEKGEELLMSGGFKYFSPEYYTEYRDPADGRTYENVLVGGALTNKPFFRELDDVMQSFSEKAGDQDSVFYYQFNDNDMNIKDILAKDKADLSVEELAFLKENASELTDEQLEEFDIKAPDESQPEPEPQPQPQPEPEPEPAKQVQASEKGFVNVSAKEFSALKASAEAGQKAFAKLERKEVEEAVEKLVFSSTNRGGHFLPKDRESLVTFMESLNEAQKKDFAGIVNSLPKSVFSETELGGGGQDIDADPAKVFNELVQAEMKASKSTYKEARDVVAVENPEIFTAYMESRL